MTSLIGTAFFLGALGSTHCIGMCGPIALAIPPVTDTSFSKFISSLIYNLGRVVTYSILGLILGTVGETFALAGFQQALSIGLGILVIALLVIYKNKQSNFQQTFLGPFFKQLREKIGYLFAKRNYGSIFLIGILNGLLPCGLIYLAVAGAVATGNSWHGALFMAVFGLGTLPLMWAMGFFGGFIGLHTRKVLRKSYPYIIALMGCLLILRGLGLNIPYLSPSASPNLENRINCH